MSYNLTTISEIVPGQETCDAWSDGDYNVLNDTIDIGLYEDDKHYKVNQPLVQNPYQILLKSRIPLSKGKLAPKQPGGDCTIRNESEREHSHKSIEQLDTLPDSGSFDSEEKYKSPQEFKTIDYRVLSYKECRKAFKNKSMANEIKKKPSYIGKLQDFDIIRLIGRGTFGKVFLAEIEGADKQYAIKCIRKDDLIDNEAAMDCTISEKDIMLKCDHPFLVNLDQLFQSELRIYFVMPYVYGCELYQYFKYPKKFDEYTLTFIMAQIVMAVGYLHKNGIAHRDLKLENVMIDSTGYIKIIDYGLSKKFEHGERLSFDKVGTLSYMAPELIGKTGHTKAVDWWAVGVILHELFVGYTPFMAKTKESRHVNIQKQKIIIPDDLKCTKQQQNISDLIEKLLTKDCEKRIGSGPSDSYEIIEHATFKNINFKKLYNKQLDSPFKPSPADIEFGSKMSCPRDNTYINQKVRQQVQSKQHIFSEFNYTNINI